MPRLRSSVRLKLDRDGETADMTGMLASWLVALGFGVAMLSLGMNVGLLAKPVLWSRCGACRRLVRRNRVCQCSHR